MKQLLCCLITLMAFLASNAQMDSTIKKFGSHIFLPSIEVGVQVPRSDIISPSIIVKSSIEYRFKNNADFFLRGSYDTYSARYSIQEANGATNNIDGTLEFADVMLGTGFRYGNKTWRGLVCVQGGLKFYDYPNALLKGNTIVIRQNRRSLFCSTTMLVTEYYFDEKSAITFTLHRNQVWRKVDFWEDRIGAYGFSMGFITSLL